VLTFGFMDEPDVPRALELGRVTLGLPFLASETVFLLGHESFVASGAGRMGRAQERLFAFLARNAVAATEWFRLPAERVLEIGVRLDL
jgi:KUP system potassium uptake protein